jgi:hypothetical protein
MDDLGYEFPRYQVPDGETMDSFLRKRTEEGVRSRYQPKNDSELFTRALKQADRELKLIQQLGLAGYFLIVWDVVEFCKRNGILVQGRGSAHCFGDYLATVEKCPESPLTRVARIAFMYGPMSDVLFSPFFGCKMSFRV